MAVSQKNKMGRLGEKNSEKEVSKEIISKIGHEMGNAVTIIRCSLNIIRTKHPQLSEMSYFNTATKEMDYLEELLRDIRNYNRMTKTEKKPLNMNKFLCDIIESVKMAEFSNDIEISLSESNNREVIYANVDEVKIKQVIINLIKNSCEAIKEKEYMDNESGKIKVFMYIEKKRKKENCIICVWDNGCGIEKDKINKIFEPMITYKSGGTGLGLSIVKDIILKHHGNVEAVSDDTGTTFRIRIPK